MCQGKGLKISWIAVDLACCGAVLEVKLVVGQGFDGYLVVSEFSIAVGPTFPPGGFGPLEENMESA